MRKRYLKILSDDDMKKIHNASLAVLEKTGMRIDHQKAREMLREVGAKIDHESKIVKFPPELVERCLKSCPKTIMWAGRNPDNDILVQIGGDILGRCTAGGINYEDLKTGEYRRAKNDDLKEFSVLVDALPNIHVCGSFNVGDVPLKTSDIHCLEMMFENQRKNVLIQCFTTQNLKYMIEMALAIRGSREELKQRPPFNTVGGMISPLFIPGEDVEMLFLAGEYGIPTSMVTQTNAGATGPITIGGTLTVGNAEILGTITLAQVAQPGHQMLYSSIPSVTDMTTGAAIFGAPENILMTVGLNQMGEEFYGIPVTQGAGEVDGVIFEQTQFERGYKTLAAALSGASIISLLGATDRAIGVSPVQLVIDDEIIEVTRRICKGIEINDDTIGLDVIDRVGPQGNFLIDVHTIRHLRKDVPFRPAIFDRDPYAVWQSKGSKGWAQKAREKALVILEEHEVEPLPDDVVKELRSIVGRADEELTK